MVTILQIRKLSSREVKSLTSGHVARWWQNQVSNPESLASDPTPKPHCLLECTMLLPGWCGDVHIEAASSACLCVVQVTEHGDRRLCANNAAGVRSLISQSVTECTTDPSNLLPSQTYCPLPCGLQCLPTLPLNPN